MIEQVLRDIGLSENEVIIYLTLLKIGAAPAGKISQESGIHRRNVYDVIDRLIEKGLVSYVIENNLKKFVAAKPEKLLEMQTEKEKLIEGIMPQLNEMQSKAEEQEVKIFRGKEGLKAILEDEAKTGKPVFCFGATGRLDEILGEPYYFNLCKRRAERGVTLRAIFNEDAKNRKITKMPKVVSKFMPKGSFHSFVPVWVYGNKVALFVWAEETAILLAIMIENKKIANAFKNYFNILWKIAKR